ncbi:trace amine-associated receptor 7g-like isoform X2 [Paramacrobiotus metropolitanus]|uniref:trace amine-associated receptor 7g-like isoform X2 n=1 Tax=Paramacrobiotus metropolitanus TaxID=2943436 RepID=UPI00244612C2|nr:trace amine-associated receptor 7g-like isoform X2 [Paramacrobiotus metropolitanus]
MIPATLAPFSQIVQFFIFLKSNDGALESNFSRVQSSETISVLRRNYHNMVANMSHSPANQHDELFYLHPPINYVLAAFFGFLIVFSVTGNLLVLMIIMRFRRMRTRTNMLLANLSAIDLLTGLLTMPFSMITAINGGWKLGETACQINGFLNALFISASIHTLMYISIHKYFSIKNVFHAILTARHIWLMMGATWIWGILFAMGLVAGWTSIEYKIGTTQCGPKVPDRNNVRESSHSIFTSVSNFVIPMIVILFCYVSIFRTFRRHIDNLNKEDQKVDNVASAQQRAVLQQKKIAITLIIVLVGFFICVAPYVTYSSAIAFAKDKLTIPKIFNPMAYICMYFASCINPVIYALRSQAFRTGYKNFFRLCCRPQKKRPLQRAVPALHESPDTGSKSKSSTSGWRRFSMAIHDAWHTLGGSRETLASSVRSRQGSIFANVSIHHPHKYHLAGVAHDFPQKPHMTLTRKANSLDGGLPAAVAAAMEIDQLLPPMGVAGVDSVSHPRLLATYRRQSSTILEERSSQLANWTSAKNPDTDSGKAESDGEIQDGHYEILRRGERAYSLHGNNDTRALRINPTVPLSASKYTTPALPVDFV